MQTEHILRHTYDEDQKKIMEVGINIQRLWRDVAPTINIMDFKGTAKKLNEWTKIVEGAYERIGFRVAVDVNPIYGDRPPEITVLSRINDRDQGVFDHEKKAWEVNKND